jgi:hypothetical protein
VIGHFDALQSVTQPLGAGAAVGCGGAMGSGARWTLAAKLALPLRRKQD